jgi:hypothetical protein
VGGRSRTEEWTIEGGHLAERCQPVVIVALGESILLTGATFADLDSSAGTVTAFVVAFAAAWRCGGSTSIAGLGSQARPATTRAAWGRSA